MRYLIIIQAMLLMTTTLTSQITIESDVLPEIGDVLEYQTFSDYEDTLSYATDGEDVEWTFSGFNITGSTIEIYQDINDTPYADSFPTANMILDFDGAPAAARRDPDRLAIVGIPNDGFGGMDFPAEVELSDEFVFQSTPMTYRTFNEDDLEVVTTLDASLIPALDSLDLSEFGIIGELESIRITLSVTQTQDVVGWGRVSFFNETREVLKVKQEEKTDTKFEIGLNVFGFPLWLDLGEIFGDEPGGGGGPLGGFDGLGGPQDVVTYKFLSADSKESIVEFSENRFQDTLGNNFLTVSGRITDDIMSGTEDISLEEAGYTLYPNPAADYLIIDHEDLNGGNVSVEIYNHTGQLLHTEREYVLGKHLPLHGLSDGPYILRVSNETQVMRSRFVLLRD